MYKYYINKYDSYNQTINSKRENLFVGV